MFLSMMIGWVSAMGVDGQVGLVMRVEGESPPTTSRPFAQFTEPDPDRWQAGASESGVDGTKVRAISYRQPTPTLQSAKPVRRAVSPCGAWLYVEGWGRPRRDLPPARARLMAGRAAEVDAMRNLARAHGTRRTPPFRIVLTEPLPDGSVRVVLESRVPQHRKP